MTGLLASPATDDFTCKEISEEACNMAEALLAELYRRQHSPEGS